MHLFAFCVPHKKFLLAKGLNILTFKKKDNARKFKKPKTATGRGKLQNKSRNEVYNGCARAL